MEVVVTTGAISCAKIKSNHHHQQTNTQFLQAGCPSCHSNNSVKALNGNKNNWQWLSRISFQCNYNWTQYNKSQHSMVCRRWLSVWVWSSLWLTGNVVGLSDTLRVQLGQVRSNWVISHTLCGGNPQYSHKSVSQKWNYYILGWTTFDRLKLVRNCLFTWSIKICCLYDILFTWQEVTMVMCCHFVSKLMESGET